MEDLPTPLQDALSSSSSPSCWRSRMRPRMRTILPRVSKSSSIASGPKQIKFSAFAYLKCRFRIAAPSDYYSQTCYCRGGQDSVQAELFLRDRCLPVFFRILRAEVVLPIMSQACQSS